MKRTVLFSWKFEIWLLLMQAGDHILYGRGKKNNKRIAMKMLMEF